MNRKKWKTAVIQRQYDDVIAEHYDLDAQNVTTRSLDLALKHIEQQGILSCESDTPLDVLDLGMGTGMFLEKLIETAKRPVDTWGVDLSPNMARIAESKIPGLKAAVDDATNIDDQFPGQPFDLVCTHFITGFVAVSHLAPRIFQRLRPGGIWSFVGASKQAYPTLRSKADSSVVKMLCGGAELSLDNMIVPDDEADLIRQLTSVGFEVEISETFEPDLHFRNMDEFMEFAYAGGWLTPFIEDLGLHNIGRTTKTLLNTVVFPVGDHHSVLLAAARKPLDA